MKADIIRMNIAMANNCMNTSDLQKKSGLPRPTLNNVMSGRSVRPVTLGKVAKALGVDVREIMIMENERK